MDDLDQIKQLKARYFRMMDTKNWDGLAAVFTDDVEIDMSNEGGGITRSVAEYMPFLRENIEDVVTVHHGHMGEITFTSPTSATGIWAMEDKLWWPEGSPMKHLHGYGHYHETYEKQEGQWRITSTTLTRLRTDVQTA
jgi:hypothetical protein